MKLKLYIISLLFITFSCKKEQKTITNTSKKAIYNLSQGKHCFKSILKNKVKKGDGYLLEKDELIVNLSINDQQVTGNYNFLPSNNKASMGSFKGTINNNIITSIYTFTKNKKEIKEEIVFKIEQDKISLLGGEKIEKNGVFVFTNTAKGIYMIQIPRVDCN